MWQKDHVSTNVSLDKSKLRQLAHLMMARHLISPSMMLMIHMCRVTAGMCCLHAPPKAASGDLAAPQHSQPDAVVLGAECVSQTLIPGVDHRSELYIWNAAAIAGSLPYPTFEPHVDRQKQL